MSDEIQSAPSLEQFGLYVSGLTQGLKREYDRGVNRDLSRQRSQDLLKRNITGVLQQAYRETLTALQQMPLESTRPTEGTAETERAARVLKPFDGLIDELFQYALQKHRSSCALSNFPEEHSPSQDYIAEVVEAIGRDWSVFSFQVNTLMSGNG